MSSKKSQISTYQLATRFITQYPDLFYCYLSTENFPSQEVGYKSRKLPLTIQQFIRVAWVNMGLIQNYTTWNEDYILCGGGYHFVRVGTLYNKEHQTNIILPSFVASSISMSSSISTSLSHLLQKRKKETTKSQTMELCYISVTCDLSYYLLIVRTVIDPKLNFNKCFCLGFIIG